LLRITIELRGASDGAADHFAGRVVGMATAQGANSYVEVVEDRPAAQVWPGDLPYVPEAQTEHALVSQVPSAPDVRNDDPDRTSVFQNGGEG